MVYHTETTSFRLQSLLCTDVTVHSAQKCSTTEEQEQINFQKEDAASQNKHWEPSNSFWAFKVYRTSRDILLTSPFVVEKGSETCWRSSSGHNTLWWDLTHPTQKPQNKAEICCLYVDGGNFTTSCGKRWAVKSHLTLKTFLWPPRVATHRQSIQMQW